MTNSKDLFSDENKKTAGNFFKFEKIGDKVSGYFVSSRLNEKPGYSPQIIYRLETEDGETINVPVKQFIADKVGAVKVGQLIGFKFVEEIDTGKPNKAKSIDVFISEKMKEPVTEKEVAF